MLFIHSDLKVVILGDASVGKTSLIQRYIQGVFTEDQVSVSTQGLSQPTKSSSPSS